jgi:hypothetical protein
MGSSGGSIELERTYSTRAACIEAGEQAVEDFNTGFYVGAKYSCVPEGDNE